jgi:phosphatidate cytidylyltransferase
MLKTRVITALVLLAILLPVLYANNQTAFAIVATVFFAAAAWESFRLFNPNPARAALIAVFWTVAFAYSVFVARQNITIFWFAISVLIWLLRLAPSLKLGLPELGSASSALLSLTYAIAIVGCFIAIAALYFHSPLYLLSVMVLVWIADIGAYFAGKAFGKRKLAPSISPGKSWEGAIGGALAVLLLSALAVAFGREALADTFVVRLYAAFGSAATVVVLVLIVAASVAGDLFESQLKRRAGVKDSSALLPGHGGVLDRIDALIPVLPLAALIDAWL